MLPASAGAAAAKVLVCVFELFYLLRAESRIALMQYGIKRGCVVRDLNYFLSNA
jgi:hypothetical protein